MCVFHFTDYKIIGNERVIDQDLMNLLFCFDLIWCLLEMLCLMGVLAELIEARYPANDSHLIIGNDGTIGKDLITNDK